MKESANEAAAAELRRLAEALALAERDRQLLAYEIHDGIVQNLTAAALLLEGAGRQATFPATDVLESYAGGLRLLRESIAEARRLIGELGTIELDERGLAATLQRLVDRFRTDFTLPVRFSCHVEGVPLPESVQHLLLRIAQESLTNAWKHSQATQVDVCLATIGNELELSITDNGRGFDLRSGQPGHYGLAGMQARASVLGTSLQIDTEPDKGTRIALRLAMPPVT